MTTYHGTEELDYKDRPQREFAEGLWHELGTRNGIRIVQLGGPGACTESSLVVPHYEISALNNFYWSEQFTHNGLRLPYAMIRLGHSGVLAVMEDCKKTGPDHRVVRFENDGSSNLRLKIIEHIESSDQGNIKIIGQLALRAKGSAYEYPDVWTHHLTLTQGNGGLLIEDVGSPDGTQIAILDQDAVTESPLDVMDVALRQLLDQELQLA